MNTLIESDKFLFTGRGTTALWLILKLLKKKSKSILMPINVCEIVMSAVRNLGFEPVFYDVDPVTGNSTPGIVKKRRTDEKILLIVHNFGRPVEIDRIMGWAAENGIFVIEDVCNALGGTLHGKPLGDFGDASIFSFGYAKIVEAGVGGGLIVKNEALYRNMQEENKNLKVYSDKIVKQHEIFEKRMKKIRTAEGSNPAMYKEIYDRFAESFVYALPEKLTHDIISALSEENLEKNIKKRTRKAKIYRQGIVNKKIIHRPQIGGEVCWRYTMLCESVEFRIGLINRLKNENIWVSSWYPRLDKLFAYSQGEFPGGEYFEKRVINFFVDHRVDDEYIVKTIEFINDYRD